MSATTSWTGCRGSAAPAATLPSVPPCKVCPFKADSYGVCNHELNGMQGQCCTRSDVAVGSAM